MHLENQIVAKGSMEERSKVAIISLMDVGQGSYFYKVNKLQPYTIQLMDTMVSQSPFSIKPFLQDMLTLYKTDRKSVV